MPTAALHSAYWKARAQAATPPLVSGPFVSYPMWQTSIICGSGFGVFQAIYEQWRPSVTTTAPPKE